MKRSPILSVLLLAAAGALSMAHGAHAFCGFYVAKADTKLFNQASQVVLARSGDRTVLTMANDYRGDLKEFALVVPVPTFLRREQVHVAERGLIDHLDAYSAPRLVEYWDSDPCAPLEEFAYAGAPAAEIARPSPRRDAKLGVKVEARYTVGEYDIVLLSARQSDGLETWLKENGYRIPSGASPVLGSYLKQGMRFFVARVNLGEQAKLGYANLRPLQIAYESPKFMLPIRLGMVNADGAQELFVYALTKKGRVETTNYRTVRLPTGAEVPLYVKDEFGPFYKAMFTRQVERDDMRTVFLEYAWDMGWCDPCAADPLSSRELRELGVFWLDGRDANAGASLSQSQVFLTRLHLRYDAKHFPEDLTFQATGDWQTFQGRYVLQHSWTGETQCDEAKSYRKGLPSRYEKQAETLAFLTGWSRVEIRKKMKLPPREARLTNPGDPWWKSIWR